MSDKQFILKAGPPAHLIDGQISFLVQGSANEPYQVVFAKRGLNITAHCTCPAGQVGQYCKHRLDILKGDPSKLKIVSGNEPQVAIIQAWLLGTDVEAALNEVRHAEAEYEREVKKLKKILSGYKKKLARSLMD